MKVDFTFAIEDKVTIRANNGRGTVIGLMRDRDGVNWASVEYVAAGVVHDNWFREKHCWPESGGDAGRSIAG